MTGSRTAALSAGRREGIAAFAEKRPPSWPSEPGINLEQ
jgi:hypothetical protein